MTFRSVLAAGNGVPSELKVLWGGNVVLDLINAASNEYSVDNLVATSGSTQLMFLGRQDPSFLSFNCSDVERASAAAPEPASLALSGLGAFAAFGFGIFRKRRAQQ